MRCLFSSYIFMMHGCNGSGLNTAIKARHIQWSRVKWSWQQCPRNLKLHRPLKFQAWEKNGRQRILIHCLVVYSGSECLTFRNDRFLIHLTTDNCDFAVLRGPARGLVRRGNGDFGFSILCALASFPKCKCKNRHFPQCSDS